MECIVFVGDMMPGRLLGNIAIISNEILHHFNSALLRVCNLEGTITNRTASLSDVKHDPKKYLSKHGISIEQGSILCTLNIDCCNLANNHILDYGTESVKDTIRFLNTANIKWFGFGKDWQTAWKPRILKFKKKLKTILSEHCSIERTVNNETERSGYKMTERTEPKFTEKTVYKVAVFGMADHFVEWKAEEHRAGINYFDIEEFLTPDMNPNREQWTNIDFVKQQIDKVRHSVALIVFSIHWGNNFQEKVPSAFQAFAHALIDMGVDIIHGHSTHHVQGIEVYKGSVVLYGCGDFLNDYDILEQVMASQAETLGAEYITHRSDLSFLYKVFLKPCMESTSKKLMIEKLELFPTQIKHGMVERCNEENKEILFTKMVGSCKQFSTNVLRTEDILVIPVT